MSDYRRRYFFRIFVLALIGALHLSCASSGVAPVSQRDTGETISPRKEPKETTRAPGGKKELHHTVVQGDTLYSIAWSHNLHYIDVAAWNAIETPYVIFPGQRLRLSAPAATQETDAGERRTGIVQSSGKVAEVKTPEAGKAVAWHWPTTGTLIRLNSPKSKKGVNIGGEKGQIIKSSASGEIVYSGSGILGYGKLIIIKHNKTYMSAYAHNSVLMVREGEHVTSGQEIARMGEDDNGRALLHFQIRKNGIPVSPIQYLPKIQS